MKTHRDILELCDVIRETGFALHRYLGPGHLEKVYENGLAHRLALQGIPVERQKSLVVQDEDGTALGHYVTDLFIANQLIVEIKAARTIAPEHTAQLLGYLKGCNIEHGLLINFGAQKFQIKKYVLSQPQDQDKVDTKSRNIE